MLPMHFDCDGHCSWWALLSCHVPSAVSCSALLQRLSHLSALTPVLRSRNSAAGRTGLMYRCDANEQLLSANIANAAVDATCWRRVVGLLDLLVWLPCVCFNSVAGKRCGKKAPKQLQWSWK